MPSVEVILRLSECQNFSGIYSSNWYTTFFYAYHLYVIFFLLDVMLLEIFVIIKKHIQVTNRYCITKFQNTLRFNGVL